MRPQVAAIIRSAPPSGRVLDVGCSGFQIALGSITIGRGDLRQAGVDYSVSEDAPAGFTFARADLNKEAIPFPDDSFDVVIASHVIEHVTDPIALFGELARVTKQNGTIFIEAPSERATMLPGMWFAYEDTRSLSYWDDPTHLGRPWPPQALHRLARCWDCEPQLVGYQTSLKDRLKALVKIPFGILLRKPAWVETGFWSLVGWASFAVIRKTQAGAPTFHYHMRRPV